MLVHNEIRIRFTETEKETFKNMINILKELEEAITEKECNWVNTTDGFTYCQDDIRALIEDLGQFARIDWAEA